MHGTIYVKDISGNVHNQEFQADNHTHGDDNEKDHVEDVLIRNVVNTWDNEERSLQSAKVTVTMQHSPCKRCFKRIPGWYNSLDNAVCGGNGNLFLVFAFGQYYVHGKGNHVWKNVDEVKTAYKELTKEGNIISKSSKVEGVKKTLISRLGFWHEPLGGKRTFIGSWKQVAEPKS